MATPIPAGRGRWRLTLHKRAYAAGIVPAVSGIGELTDARSRKLVQALDAPAEFSFTVDGHSPQAAQIVELATDVIAWRWDEASGRDVPAFRGCVTHAQDTISEQTHTTAFVAHDYLALVGRRFYTNATAVVFSATDQDTIAAAIVAAAGARSSTSGTNFAPGSYLPLSVQLVDASGATRAPSGQVRDRAFTGQSSMGDMLDQLAKVINGFDYDCWPRSDLFGVDVIRIFYPYQGVQRTYPQLVWGSTVSNLTRTVDSSDYANYQRVVGNNGSADPNTAQVYGEAWNADSNNVTVATQGLWMNGANASDVTIAQTLRDKASGDLGRSGVLVPTYTVGLRPDAYSWGNPNMGDVVPLVVVSGRLDVSTTIRVMGLTYDIGDDGQEDVTLTLGRPDTTIYDIFTAQARDVNALARR
jgi:hypothetical protein